MVKYKIIDNFLSNSDFIELASHIVPGQEDVSGQTSNFGWIWMFAQTSLDEPDHLKKVTDIKPLNPLQQHFWCHPVWHRCASINMGTLPYLGALLGKINPMAVHRIFANFTVQQEKRVRSQFHIDYAGKPLTHKQHPSMITSIFYMNTTNGPTILEDGTEIECRANRLVSYPYETFHAGTLCTDQPYRIVINLNYFADTATEFGAEVNNMYGE